MEKSTLFLTVALLCLCFLRIAEAQQSPVAIQKHGFEIFVYPAEVYFGDPIYIAIHLKNISEETLHRNINFDRLNFSVSLHSDNISTTYYLLPEDKFSSAIGHDGPSARRSFQPGESVLVFVCYGEVPALEDMETTFWKEAKTLWEEGKNVVAHLMISDFSSNAITIKPRPGVEMELLQRWRKETPESLLPIPFDQAVAEGNYWFHYLEENLYDRYGAFPLTPKAGFVSTERTLKINRNDRWFFPSNDRFIKVQNQDYFPYFFLQRGNRKPGDPICPETWQSWKELEESLSPSTMRDEIRMTRIIIQYCDTKEETVLKELKEWFGKMNEIQRMVMAESFRHRTENVFIQRNYVNNAEDLVRPFRDIYRAIREYDLAPIPEVN